MFAIPTKYRNYWLQHEYIFLGALHEFIWLVKKNQKIDIILESYISLNFPPSSGTKKGSHECHFDHFINFFWVKRTFTTELWNKKLISLYKSSEIGKQRITDGLDRYSLT